MNTSLSIQSLLATTLDHLPIAAPDETSMEAALLSQANVLSMIFKYQIQVALTHPQGSPEAEDAIRLAMKAQAQSGRILQQLLRAKKAASQDFAPPRRETKPAAPSSAAPSSKPSSAPDKSPSRETSPPPAATPPALASRPSPPGPTERSLSRAAS